MDKLRCGLSETAYDNTISIGQLKCATDGGMVSELRNYIANLNTSGSIALNITKASAYLKNQRKQLEAHFVPGLIQKIADLGFMGINVPEEYGGVGADEVTKALVIMEFAKYDASVAELLAVHTLSSDIILKHEWFQVLYQQYGAG